jgi:outer membrane protein OmpA-like peptidoglycan-associated protein
MPHAHVSHRGSSLGRALTQALVLSLLPLGTAFAQSHPAVRVTRDETEIKPFRARGEVYMTARKGTLLEVIYIDGDRYEHPDSNWYWVVLPRDLSGAGRAGWIRGDAVEYVPPQEPAPAPRVSLAEAPQAVQARNEPRDAALPARAPVEEVPTARPVIPDVVLNFEFDNSELTDEARRQLATAFPAPTASARRISVALEGHADWTGPDTYNQKLGQARADSVRRYLTEQLRIPTEQISVVSYGEANPVAPNTTREGRARNRRVVIKGGA